METANTVDVSLRSGLEVKDAPLKAVDLEVFMQDVVIASSIDLRCLQT